MQLCIQKPPGFEKIRLLRKFYDVLKDIFIVLDSLLLHFTLVYKYFLSSEIRNSLENSLKIE